MSESKLSDPDQVPSNYVRFKGVGDVHIALLVLGGGLIAWLTYKAVSK